MNIISAANFPQIESFCWVYWLWPAPLFSWTTMFQHMGIKRTHLE